MLLILANQQDAVAAELAARWNSCGAMLLTPKDLSTVGWRWDPVQSAKAQAVVGGRKISATEITGVLTLLSSVQEKHLEHIVPEDRSYVASEMNAFLLAWLSSLKCPVLNRPTPNCLCGPNWRLEQWMHVAWRFGIPGAPIRRTTWESPPAGSPEAGTRVFVVGDRCVGSDDPVLAGYALRLARAAEVELLEVVLSGSGKQCSLVHASSLPDLSFTGVAQSVLSYLLRRTSC